MDPLSIAASVIALVGAANNVYNILQAIRNADQALQSLTREVNTLRGFLRSIEKALDDCRSSPYALTHIDPAFWKESKIALSDCEETLDGLGSILTKAPKRPSRSNTLFRRARAAAELRSRSGDITSFREKISMSILSLQTLLQVINVSFSLRSNESQDHILRELKELKHALKRSSQVATASYSALFLNEHDVRLVHHLKGLIRVAHEFHASASTTASTVMGSGETQPPPTDYGDDDSRSGCPSRLPSMKMRQIETFLSQSHQVSRTNTSSTSNDKKDEEVMSPNITKPHVVPDTRDVDPSHTFNTIFTNGFSKIAQRALQQLDLLKAEGLLKEALRWYSTSGSEDTNHHRRLQTQLALCNLLQGNIQEARDLILDLVDSSNEKDIVAHQLLYALALLQSHELDFEGARDTSKRLWQALQGMPHCTALGEKEAMRILANSYKETGDNLLADAIEAEVPDVRLFEPVPRMVDFIVGCEELLGKFVGLQDCSGAPSHPSLADLIHRLPIATQPSSLEVRQLCKAATSSLKGPPEEADDNMSTKSQPIPAKGNAKAKKRSWSNLRALLTTLRTVPQESTSDTSVNTANYYSQKQRLSPKTKKRVKISNPASKLPQDAVFRFPAYLVPSMQNPIKSTRSWFSKTDPVMLSHDVSASSSMDTGYVTEQSNDNSSSTTGEHDGNDDDDDDDGVVVVVVEDDGVDEHRQSLQREFSFRAGVVDYILPQITCHELDDTAVAELMDTSPQSGFLRTQERDSDYQHCNARGLRPSPGPCDSQNRTHYAYLNGDSFEKASGYGEDVFEDISQRVEDEIYNLLSPCKPAYAQSEQSAASLNKTPTWTSGIWLSSSESGSNVSSYFDPMTQSSSQTSLSCSRTWPRVADDDHITDDYSPSSLRLTKSQDSKLEQRSESLETISLSKGPDEPDWDMELIQPASVFRFGGSIDDATDDLCQPRNLHTRKRTHQEFTHIVRRLCRSDQSVPPRKTTFRRLSRNGHSDPPRKTTLRRRLRAKPMARFSRLLNRDSQTGEHDLRFNVNSSLYSGPDAVVGPFTDLETDVSSPSG